MYIITKNGNNKKYQRLRGYKMSFIGVISNRKCFDNVKKEILKKQENDGVNIIHINLRSIENIKNIKFETIIIENKLDKFSEKEESLKKICASCNYILINTDLNKEYNIIKNKNISVITYGLNRKADITISSITDSDILIYCQKNMYNKIGNKFEIEERRIKRREKNTLKIDEILILYTILRLYNKPITEQL